MQKADNRFYSISEYESIASHLRVIPAKGILDRDRYELRESVCIIDGNGQEYCLPQYFTSDGGTIAWWARPMFPSGGRAIPAYLIHDYYCDKATRSGKYYYRSIGDNQFYDHLRSCGYAKWRCWIMSKAVKRYGDILKAKGVLK